ncbi:2907_t:CDS:2 [Paraglomus brasilianum]|uniref:2907_t:CDS:1 n=1 Tax=Paraglomus brasilianum TaxID=144538 RepID=A0A9N8VWV0_9GLOM|nr:2907_t:CDS:2 [Paraglomus brasilianum]
MPQVLNRRHHDDPSGPLLNNTSSSQSEHGVKEKKRSLTSRIRRTVIWTGMTFGVIWWFEVVRGVYEILSWDSPLVSLFLTSVVCLLISTTILFYVQFYLPLISRTAPPNYKRWHENVTLRKYIPVATLFGTFGVIGLIIASWPVWGFWSVVVVTVLLRGGTEGLDVIWVIWEWGVLNKDKGSMASNDLRTKFEFKRSVHLEQTK